MAVVGLARPRPRTSPRERKRRSPRQADRVGARDVERLAADVRGGHLRERPLAGDGDGDRAAARAEVEHAPRTIGGERCNAASTSVSVSGRGMSTAGENFEGRPQNSRRPTRYATGSPSRRRFASAKNASRVRDRARRLHARSATRDRVRARGRAARVHRPAPAPTARAPREPRRSRGTTGREHLHLAAVVLLDAAALHPDLDQHALRSDVFRPGQSHDARQRKRVEAMREHGSGHLRRIAVSPAIEGQPVSDLDAIAFRNLEQSASADVASAPRLACSSQKPGRSRLEVRAPGHRRGDLIVRPRREPVREVAHDARVTVRAKQVVDVVRRRTRATQVARCSSGSTTRRVAFSRSGRTRPSTAPRRRARTPLPARRATR